MFFIYQCKCSVDLCIEKHKRKYENNDSSLSKFRVKIFINKETKITNRRKSSFEFALLIVKNNELNLLYMTNLPLELSMSNISMGTQYYDSHVTLNVCLHSLHTYIACIVPWYVFADLTINYLNERLIVNNKISNT